MQLHFNQPIFTLTTKVGSQAKKQKGFGSLIELMIVVAIIAILASIAIPAYHHYIKKAKVSEAYTLFGGFKTEVGVFYVFNGHYPASLSSLEGLVTRGNYVVGMEYTFGGANDPKLDVMVKGFPHGEDIISWQWDNWDGKWICNPMENPSTTIQSRYLLPPCK